MCDSLGWKLQDRVLKTPLCVSRPDFWASEQKKPFNLFSFVVGHKPEWAFCLSSLSKEEASNHIHIKNSFLPFCRKRSLQMSYHQGHHLSVIYLVVVVGWDNSVKQTRRGNFNWNSFFEHREAAAQKWTQWMSDNGFVLELWMNWITFYKVFLMIYFKNLTYPNRGE